MFQQFGPFYLIAEWYPHARSAHPPGHLLVGTLLPPLGCAVCAGFSWTGPFPQACAREQNCWVRRSSALLREDCALSVPASFLCLPRLANTCYFLSSKRVLLSQPSCGRFYGFKLRFLNDEVCRTSFHVLTGHLSVFFGKMIYSCWSGWEAGRRTRKWKGGRRGRAGK